jgi:ribosomal protein L6P/L9E
MLSAGLPRRFAAVLLLAASLTAGLTGCVSLSGCDFALATHTETRSSSVALAEASPVKVVTRNGSVKITASEKPELSISATIKATTPERLAAYVIDVSRDDDGMLFIRPTAPDGEWKNNEGVSFEITLPGTTKVHVEASNGPVTIVGTAGDATLNSSNGAITIENHTGKIVADTSNGRIEAKQLNGTIHADTSNGRIEVELVEGVTGPVKLDTSNGSISLSVGRSFAGQIKLDTSNGGIDIEAPGDAKVRRGRSEATIDLATPGEQSIIDTSNGRITFKVRSPM